MIPSLRDFAAATLGIIGWAIGESYSQTLSPVAPVAVAASSGVNYWYVGGGIAVLLVIAAVVLFIRYRKRNPAGAAKVQASAVADVEAFGRAIAAAVDRAVDKGLAARAGAVGSPTPAATAGPATPAPATEALPVRGRNAQPGTFTITLHVDGTPATDVPAINAAVTAAYFG